MTPDQANAAYLAKTTPEATAAALVVIQAYVGDLYTAADYAADCAAELAAALSSYSETLR